MQRSRITDRKGEWFEIWQDDKESVIDTMIRNMRSDLDNGYNYFGNSIQKQMRDIENYKKQFDSEMDKFKSMSDDEVDRWCFYDLKKRGSIL